MSIVSPQKTAEHQPGMRSDLGRHRPFDQGLIILWEIVHESSGRVPVPTGAGQRKDYLNNNKLSDLMA
jgi:hypothetical protein